MEALANNQVFQEVHTAYRNLEEQAQRYMGSPTPLSRQEIEFGVYWAKGPFGAYYKYKNGVMMLESHQKFLVLQSRFAEKVEKVDKYLEAMEAADNQNTVVSAEMVNFSKGSSKAEGKLYASAGMSDIDPLLQGPKDPEKPPNLLRDTFKVSRGDAGTRLQDNIRTRLEPSENLTRLLMNYERYEEFVYDPGDNTDTIGYGHVLLPGESYPNGISKKDAGLLLQKDLKEIFTAKSLDPFLKEYNIKLTQNQYDALVLFTYNTGEYVWDLDFNLKRMLINGNYTADDIIEGFLGWTTTGDDSGRRWKSGGLYRRRMDEANMFNNGIYERNETRPIPGGYE
jgi:GH24 family phage-related lysozyme (muramidase)